LKINAVFIPRIKTKKEKSFPGEYHKKYLAVAYLATAIIIGVIIYSLNEDNVNVMSEAFGKYFSVYLNKSKPEIYIGLLAKVLPYIFFMLIFSTSTVGNILIYVFCFIKLAGLGASTAFIYSQYGIAGIKYCFFIFLPSKFLLILAILLLGKQCLKISKDVREKVRVNEVELKNRIIRVFISCLIFLLSAGIELLLTTTFLPHTGISSLL